jgi:opacity protein-like surface antigen
MSKAGWILGLLILGSNEMARAETGLFDRFRQTSACEEYSDECTKTLRSIGCMSECDSQNSGSCSAPTPCCRYWSVFGGWNQASEYVGEEQTPPPNIVRNGTYEDGFLVGLSRGRCLTQNLRGEIEFAYRRNEADQWSAVPAGAPLAPVNWNGNINVYTGMSNLILDFGNCKCRKLTPYAGAGIGFAIVDGNFSSLTTTSSIDQTAFAFQGFGGVTYRAKDNTRLFAEYRYLGSTDLDLINTTNGQAFGSDPYQAHGVILGIQFRR